MRARARNAAGSLVLLALAAGAVAWAVLGVDRRAEREQAAKERSERIFAFEAKDVRELLVSAKGETTRLVREGDGWRLVEPIAADADGFAADSMAEKLAALRRKREAAPAPGGDLARFGLAPPRATVEATLASGKKETLALGDESGFDSSLFVRPSSGEVDAVGADARWALERTPLDLRDRRIAPFARANVAALRVEGAWAVKKAGDGWAFDPPGPAVDPAKVAQALGALELLRAVRFDDHGTLGKPSRVVVVSAADGTELARIELGATKDEETLVRSRRTPGVAAVPRSALEAIPAAAKDLEAPAPAAKPSGPSKQG
jgi:hypothetical protein